MSFAQENGYTPESFEDIISDIREGINEQFTTSYTEESFVGTGWYKYAYSIAQKVQEGEIKSSEIFQKLQEYIPLTNESIQRPSVSFPGLVDSFTSNGYVASVKPPIEADAGKVGICVDVTDDHARGVIEITNYANLVSGTDDDIQVGATIFTFQSGAVTLGDATAQAATSNAATATSLAAQINAHLDANQEVEALADGAKVYIRAIERGTAGNSLDLIYTDNDSNVGLTVSAATLLGGVDGEEVDYDDTRLEICTLIKNFVAAGMVFIGNERLNITISNGQSFPFAYTLPERTPLLFRLTAVKSENTLLAVPSDEAIRQVIFDNFHARYRLGWNLEPQRYFTLSDALWAESVLLEWSDDNGSNWYDDVYDALYTDLFTLDLEDIEVLIS